jgi:hypothetical protein
MEKKCLPGCKKFHGGEIQHHKDCFYYPESLSEMYDDLKLKSENKYSEQDMIDFGNKMQLVSDVDFDGNIKFEFNPSEAIKQFKNKEQ